VISPIILILIGIAVGILTGVTGSSGVLIVVPALSLLGLSFQESVGSSLLVDVITTISVIIAYMKNKNVDVRLALLLGVGAVIGAQVGTRLALAVPETPLEAVFAVFAIVMAIRSFSRIKKREDKKVEDGGQVRTSPSLIRRVIGIPSLSFLVGIVTGTLGASGGIMFIAVMMILEPGLPIKRMIGTATLGMLLSAISGASAYIYTGVIDIYASIVIGIIALISGYFFAKLANKADPRYIYAFLGSIFVVTAMTEAIKILH
jgi:uncharacterized membrane protein YfcA